MKTISLEHQHYCPGCKSTITITGRAFSPKEEIKHTCVACGDDSVFCFQPGEGRPRLKV